VAFSYREDNMLFDSLNLQLEENSLNLLVGPSGAGKSTLGRIIAGIERPVKGDVCIGGHSILGQDLAFVLRGETIEAERHYELWRSSGNSIDTVQANYGISMLYLRHHPQYLRDMGYAERLLNDAFELASSSESSQFTRIFNRNGYALVLFRKGERNRAIELLTWAEQELSKIDGDVSVMHRSVILFNIAQCHSANGNSDSSLSIICTVSRTYFSIEFRLPVHGELQIQAATGV